MDEVTCNKTDPRSIGLVTVEPCLHELSEVWGASRGARTLVYDKMYRTFCAPKFRQTYRGIYGPLAALRGIRQKLKNRLQFLRNPSSRYTYPNSFDLPEDAVVFAPVIADRLVVVSHSARKILKLFRYTKSKDGSLHTEIRGLDFMGQNDLSEHAPIIYDKGTTSNGTDWMLAEFAPNSSPPNLFYATPFFHRRWQKWKADQVIPFLTKMYQASGVTTLSRDEVFDRYQRAWSTLDTQEKGIGVSVKESHSLTYLQQWEFSEELIVAQIYGDVMAAHVHRSSKRNWKIIDWGKTRRGPIVRDLLADYFGLPEGKNWLQSSFAAWIKGDLDLENLPREVRSDLDQLRKVHTTILGHELSFRDLDGIIRLAAVDEAARLIENGEADGALRIISHWFPCARCSHS